MSLDAMIDPIIEVSRRAGNVIMKYFEEGTSINIKADGSPVTAADQEAEKIIIPILRDLTPSIPIVAEESVAEGNLPQAHGNTFWLVDPLDGTKEFINQRTDFTVNIGLIRGGLPVLGVVLTPYDGLIWAGSKTTGAFIENKKGSRERISTREPNGEKLTVVASRSHRSPELENYIATLNVKESISRGSSLKFCLLASGQADIYPRLGPTMEWDTAAGHAVLLAAGGRLTNFDGTTFKYGKPDFKNGWFIAYGN